jgi:glycosyltransferase involved in cell wall biosynthesis
MKIHFFVRTLDEATGGGSHYNSIAYMRALMAAGHTVVAHVMYDVPYNSFPEGITPIVHKGFGLSFLQERKLIAELLKQYENEADIFFLYAVEFAWGGGLYRRTGGKKPVVVFMDAYLSSMRRVKPKNFSLWLYQFKRLPWDKTIGLTDAKHVDQFMPVSPYVGDAYKKFGFPKDRFTVLPSIVPPPPKEFATYYKQTGTVQILYVGRLIYEKGVDLLIDALEKLNGYNWKLVIVGDGEMRKEIENRVATSGLPIEVRGWVTREEVWEAYYTSDIFVHPARWSDPGPRSITDALWCGLPVIVPDTGGSSWIAGNAGLVFKTGDITTLIEALRTLLINNDGIRDSLTANAQERAEVSKESVVYPQLEKILLSAIKNV